MGQITVLDQNMINMIAAGEVIERPASVVKELMENSIDAGATKITVSTEDGGRKLISITDNGWGMDEEDLSRAFESHSTSKIRTDKDLHSISTLGFRGEALASIASVALVRATSRTKKSLQGNCIEIDCDKKNTVSPCSTDYGTLIQVRDIFYKLPARRKFLRTANTELGHISEQFTRIALANTNLDLILSHNGKELYRLRDQRSLRERIAELFSAEIAENLIETQSDEKGLEIFAFLGRPEISRTNNKLQYIFLNGRFIRDKFISHAIREAYRGNIEPNRFPVVFLFIKMPFDNYDINVHPTKIEVRFYNSNLVHSQILGVLRERLLGVNLDIDAKLPARQLQAEQTLKEPTDERSQRINEAMAEFFRKHRTVQTQQQLSFRSKKRGKIVPIRDIERDRLSAMQKLEQPITTEAQKKFLQIHDSFIVTQTDEGFVIIDQHALHERILYENLRNRISCGKLESQKLLIPESFQITGGQTDTIEQYCDVFEKLGIELLPFGPKAMSIQAFPTLLGKAEPVDFVQDMLDLLIDKGKEFDAEKLLDEVLNMAACKGAIKAGQKLSNSEMEQLLADREKIASASRCPHGRPAAITFSIAELEKQFKRT